MHTLKKLWGEAGEFIINGATNICNDPLPEHANEIKTERTKEGQAKPDQHAELKVRAHLVHVANRVAGAAFRDDLIIAKAAIDDDAKRLSDAEVE